MTITDTERSQHARAASHVRRRKMVDSTAKFESVEAVRLRKQVMVTGVQVAREVTVVPPEDFSTLGIDQGYQRVRIGGKVNSLVSVLLGGGQIPDAIHIAQRPDDSRWIVDGQQRFWAHVETKRPIKAHIHLVSDRDAEVRLFYALNSRYALTPKNVIKGWPGPTGDLVRRLNASDKSPLRGMINMTNDSTRPIDSSALVKAMLAAVTGTVPRGDTVTSILPRMDSALRLAGGMAWAEAYVQLMTAVFGPSSGKGGRRVRTLPMLALANVAHRRFMAAGRPIFPPSTSRLRAVNWDNVVPSHAQKYLALLEDRIEKLWK